MTVMSDVQVLRPHICGLLLQSQGLNELSQQGDCQSTLSGFMVSAQGWEDRTC